MTSSTRIRFGALAAAAAVVAGGFFAAAPANAATGTIILGTDTYTEGDWGAGLNVAGTGFAPDSTVTVTVQSSDAAVGVIDTHQLSTPVGADGSFQETYTPTGILPLPAAGETITVSATTDAGDDSNAVALTVNPAVVPAPKGLKASVSTITTADLGNKEVGFDIVGGGYTPGEWVVITAVYNGTPVFGNIRVQAGPDGSIAAEHISITGALEAGSVTVTAVGETSGVSQSVTVSVTGETIVTGGGNEGLGGSAAPAATAQATRLPVVSG